MTFRSIVPLGALLLLAAAPRLQLPPADWAIAAPESQGMSAAKLDAMREGLAARKTAALLVVRHDRLVYEWYAPGRSLKARHYTASMAKAIVGGMSTAIAMTDGRLSLDDRAASYIPQWKQDPHKSRITIRQLGSHTSGLSDAEDAGLPHDKLTGWKGDFWKRGDPPRDPFTLSRDAAPMVYEPGQRLQYSNPGIAILAWVVTGALKSDIRTLLRARVMTPLGVADADWSVGYESTFTVDGLPLVATWGGGSVTPRAVARVGLLALRRGQWQGRQLLSERAVRAVTADAGTPGHGGIGWWSNTESVDPCLPADAFWGSGAGHQTLLVVPSLDLVVVRNGERIAEPAANDPAHFHEPVSRYLSCPLIDAVIDSVRR